MYDIIVVGAGVVGSLIARELAKYELAVLVLEQFGDVGNKSSQANSAIIHSGYDPKPNTLKAKLNVEGNKLYTQLVEELDVKFIRNGSLTVAFNPEQCLLLQELFDRAKVNGVETELLSGAEARKLEPNLVDDVCMALYAKTAGIIDPFNLVVHAMENALDNGVSLNLNHKITKIIKEKDYFVVVCDNNATFKTKCVINASGVNAQSISDLINEKYFSITPRKGEYFVLDHFDDSFLKCVVFPLPGAKGKGVLCTPTTSNNYLIGPSSEFVEEFDDNATDKDTLDLVRTRANGLLKNIPFSQAIRVFSGLRATPSTGDFVIDMREKGFINVAGIESPGLACAPAIAKYVVNEFIVKLFELKEKTSFNPYVKKYLKMQTLDKTQRDEAIKQSTKYGRLVCFCEKVSEQEILDTLNRSCPPHSIKGVKKRVRAGFGKCQGGMCQVNVAKVLASHYNIPLENVPYDDEITLSNDGKGGGVGE